MNPSTHHRHRHRHRPFALAALGFVLLAAAPAPAQYVSSTPARPFPGYINEALRADPYMNAWDIGVNVRLRIEDKDGAGFTYSGSNADFRDKGTALNADNINSYFLSRIMPRVGYTDKWWSFLVELRSSGSYSDERGDQRAPADATKPGRAL